MDTLLFRIRSTDSFKPTESGASVILASNRKVENKPPASTTVASILSNIQGTENAVHSRAGPNDENGSKVSPSGQTNQAKRSSIPRPVAPSNSFSSGNKNSSGVQVTRTASNASAGRYVPTTNNSKPFVSNKEQKK